jgi:hypothetical protein
MGPHKSIPPYIWSRLCRRWASESRASRDRMHNGRGVRLQLDGDVRRASSMVGQRRHAIVYYATANRRLVHAAGHTCSPSWTARPHRNRPLLAARNCRAGRPTPQHAPCSATSIIRSDPGSDRTTKRRIVNASRKGSHGRPTRTPRRDCRLSSAIVHRLYRKRGLNQPYDRYNYPFLG